MVKGIGGETVSGYIKDYRKELESDIWLMPPLYHRVWQYLKYKVNHEENEIPMRDGSKFKIKPGQHLTSIRRIAKEVGWYEGRTWKEPNPKTIKTILDWLVKSQMIEIYAGMGNRQYTLITLLNWENYQSTEQMGNSKVTVKKQSMDINKNDKELKNIYIADFESKFEAFWSKYPKKQGKAKAKEKMLKYHEQGLDWDKVMQGLESYIAYIAEVRASGFDRQYMDGSTFVNQRRWEDDWTAQSKTAYKPTFKKVAPIPLVQLTKEEEARLEWVYRKRGII